MQSAAIISLCVLAAVGYGIAHDQVTARVCVEYFTIGHPPIFPTDDPTLLGLGWGILATWWVGLILGVGLACAARFGSKPGRSVRSLLRPIATLVLVMGISATIFGFVGYWLAESGSVWLVEPLASRVPPEKQSAFIADLWAHSASYAIGGIGGLAVMIRVDRAPGFSATILCTMVHSRERKAGSSHRQAFSTPSFPVDRHSDFLP